MIDASLSSYNKTIFPTLRNYGASKSLDTMIEAFKLFKESTKVFSKEVETFVNQNSSNELKLDHISRDLNFGTFL